MVRGGSARNYVLLCGSIAYALDACSAQRNDSPDSSRASPHAPMAATVSESSRFDAGHVLAPRDVQRDAGATSTLDASQRSAQARSDAAAPIGANEPDGGALAGASRAEWPSASRPELIGPIAGPGSPLAQSMLGPYGTDLGWSFEHQGQLFMLFGDTMPYARYYCDVPDPTVDDAIARLPTDLSASVPVLQFLTDPASALASFSPIQVFRDAQSLALGLGQTPLTGFSDGAHAFAAFNRDDYVRCGFDPQKGASCDESAGFLCADDVGECEPPSSDGIDLCELGTGNGCNAFQLCTQSVTGLCFDPTSSQYDGTPQSELYAVAHNITFATQRDDEPELYDFAFILASKKFHNLTARTVAQFAGGSKGNDYGPGHDALLFWGRPGFTGEQGREAQLYFMVHDLPFTTDPETQLVNFEPRYFAGLDHDGEPIWSDAQADAHPLAQDGSADGNPHEALVMVNQMAVSFLPEPIARWVMIYGGDLPDPLLVDPAAARAGAKPGAIMVRYAKQPWGPWTAPEALLVPGSPYAVGDPYGPGGFLYHYDCTDTATASCARTDPVRPPDTYFPGCPTPSVQTDIGHLYGSNVIDAYTRANGDDGLDVFWNVSTWNPYGVVLMKTTFTR